MTWESALAFALAVAIFAATPGPAILACVAQALTSGFRRSLGLMVGIVLGDVLFLLLAIFGLSAVAQLLGGLFLAVKVGGGAYLVWLGWKMWVREPQPLDIGAADTSRAGWRGFWAGLFVTLSNPKVILFYMGFLPAFMDLQELAARDIWVTALILVSVLMAVNSAYAFSAARARTVFTSHRARRNMNRGAGTVMIGTGVVIATR